MLKTEASYAEVLEEVLKELGGIEVLFEDAADFYSGFVDCHVLLADGRVFAYRYDYGSCPVCDEWQTRNLSDEQVKEEMKRDATYFDDIAQYKKWIATLPK